MPKQKTLYFGGSFNPVGHHHITVALAAKVLGEYDKVCFLPTYDAPHKTDLIEYKHRAAMLDLAISYFPSLIQNDLEQRLFEETGRKNYTIDTVRAIKARFNEDEVHLLVGADSYKQLPNWHLHEELIKEAKFVVIGREGADNVFPWKPYILLSEPIANLSSTMIRTNIAKGIDISNWLDSSVEKYIKEHKLYEKN